MRSGQAALLLALAACAAGGGDGADNAAVMRAWQGASSRVEVTAQGTVVRLLGVRRGRSGTHEGFLLRLTGSAPPLTLRVEDNIDVTGPIPLRAGDAVLVRGEYEFDPRGGVIHWTHHDARGRHPAGFIEIRGKRFS